MKKFGLFLIAIPVLIISLYVLHVPAMRLISAIGAPSDAAYPQLPDTVQSDTYEMVRLFEGYQPEMRYDTQAQEYAMIITMVEGADPGWSGRHTMRVDNDGHEIARERIQQDDIEGFMTSVQGPDLYHVPERAYPPTYEMTEIADVLTVADFRFDHFEDWPYFYYFFPVIPFDWEATGFYELSHMDETFRFRLSTDFFGGFAYLGSNRDLQFYYYRPLQGSDVAFVAVAESSYLSPMSGPDIHRQGYGFYVLRPK